MDAVEHAQSGHPGAPMGLADIAEVLWSDILKYNPRNPHWFNRDRCVLSNGHASLLLYAVLHLTGYDLTLDDLRQFRTLHSKTPGHPEMEMTPGIETTTGPLGQGLANAVGMAMAEKILAARFNRAGFEIVDHKTYVFLGDGCMMEGISHEVSSLAGTLGLGKLIAIWDDNRISIDGVVDRWFGDDTPKRFEAYQWHVIRNVDGHNPEAVLKALEEAQAEGRRPSLICCRTQIGYGAPNKANTAHCHGSPLGAKEIALAKSNLEWPHGPFEIPEAYYQAWDHQEAGQRVEQTWETLFQRYLATYPALGHEFLRGQQSALPMRWKTLTHDIIRNLDSDPQYAGFQSIATRKASQAILGFYAKDLPELIGGSADLTESNGTFWQGAAVIDRDHWMGNYIHYGVREFGMNAICNGLSLHGGLIPYNATFLTFLDYGRNAVRMAAMMKQRVIFVFTHDSIGLGEDGPTHQPIEHLTMLRATPNLQCFRPCDGVETAVAWRQAILSVEIPSVLVLTRQNLPLQQRDWDRLAVEDLEKGGYILRESHSGSEPLDLILMATGSEVQWASVAYDRLVEAGYRVRVVSMLCVELFLAQGSTYQQSVLPDETLEKRLVIEAGSSLCWHRFVRSGKQILGIDTFGASAPGPVLWQHFGFTTEAVVEKALGIIKRSESDGNSGGN